MFSLRKPWKKATGVAEPGAHRARLRCESLEDRVTPAAVVSGQTLIVSGTSGNDDIRVQQLSHNQFAVMVNNVSQGTFSTDTIKWVEMRGLGGHDQLNGSTSSVPVTLRGGRGVDTLNDGRFNDILIGGEGRDSLSSGAGSDLLIGGRGTDDLNSWGGPRRPCRRPRH